MQDFQLLLSGGSADITLSRLQSIITFNHTHGGSRGVCDRFEKYVWYQVLEKHTFSTLPKLLYFLLSLSLSLAFRSSTSHIFLSHLASLSFSAPHPLFYLSSPSFCLLLLTTPTLSLSLSLSLSYVFTSSSRMFWRVVSHMNNTQKQQLLYFATGSAALPASIDTSNRGPSKPAS